MTLHAVQWTTRDHRVPRPGSSRRVVVLAAALVLCLSALCVAAAASSAATSSATPASVATGSPTAIVPADPGALHTIEGGPGARYVPLHEIPATAQVVTVGIYWASIGGLDFQENTSVITAYLWFKWRGADPMPSVSFRNAVEDWELTTTLTSEKPRKLPDGSMYQEMRVNGRFYQPFDPGAFPLDQQDVALYLEDVQKPIDEVVFVPDTESSGFDTNMDIPGWTPVNLTAQAFAHDYQTNFGDGGPASIGSASLVFALHIQRHADSFTWKLLFPLVIVMFTNWLALLLRPNWIDLRTGMPATALLTLVFLQITYSTNLWCLVLTR